MNTETCEVCGKAYPSNCVCVACANCGKVVVGKLIADSEIQFCKKCLEQEIKSLQKDIFDF